MPLEFDMKVVKVGNSLRITIPKEIVRYLDINKGEVLKISVTDSEIKIRKA